MLHQRNEKQSRTHSQKDAQWGDITYLLAFLSSDLVHTRGINVVSEMQRFTRKIEGAAYKNVNVWSSEQPKSSSVLQGVKTQRGGSHHMSSGGT